MPVIESEQVINGKPYLVRVDTGKRLATTYLWWLTLGVFGAHRFYLGRKGSGVLFACTGGVFGIGWVADLINIPSMVKGYNLEAGIQS